MTLHRCQNQTVYLVALAILGLMTNAAVGDEPNVSKVEFNRDVRPILSDACFACHGPDKGKRKSELRLDNAAGLDAARKGDAISLAKPAESELLRRIQSTEADEVMPPLDSGIKLTAKQIAILEQWVKQGAPFQKHWAFIPPARPQTSNVKTSIDELLDRRMREAELKPATAADRATLIRRLSLDVIGLPPTPAEVSDFANDKSANAYEKVVDRLLASKHHGERMAVYWLDVVRYADSVGYHKDSHRNVWMYRDYVIDSFNRNKPFDQFTIEQLAGDLLAGDPLKGNKFEQYQWKVASGFNRMNQTTSEGGAQAKEYLAKYSADRVRNTAAIFLGATLGCAECHDHKYDPFTTKDFYSFAAFFGDLQERGVGFPGETALPTRTQLAEWEAAENELASLKKSAADDARIVELELKIKQLSDSKKWSKTIITVSGKPRPIRILPRGNWLDDSGPVVEPAIPEFLGALTVTDRATRMDLAKWIVSRENPLTARVFVNRLWKLFFGRGLSRTLDDVGAQGQWPTHPELLDWLAVEFIESGWNVRHMIKLMLMSNAYQRTSIPTDTQRLQDPENRYLARQSRFRLEAEFVRDNALAISGLLSRKAGGRSVKPYQPANYWYRLYKDGKYNQDHGDDLYRRGVYTYWRRSFWHPSLQAFDAPAREECVAQRPNSNTPQQSLVLLNDPTYVEAARVFATRLIKDGGSTTADRLRHAFQLAVAREPSALELKTLTNLLQRKTSRYAADEAAANLLNSLGESPTPKGIKAVELAAWTSVARVILNLHETITRN